QAITLPQAQQRVGRQEVLGRQVISRLDLITLGINQLQQGTNVLASCRTILGIHNLHATQTGQFVGLSGHRNTLVHTHEGDETRLLGDDRVGVRIPLSHDLARLHFHAGFHGEFSTVGQLVPFTLTPMGISDSQCRRTGYHNQVAVLFLNGLHVMQTDRAAMLHLNVVHCRCPRSRTTDVERPHGQLGSRLTDGLSCDYTNRLTRIHQVATSQVATITFGTNTVAGITGNGGAHDQLVHTRFLDRRDQRFVEQGTARHQNILGVAGCIDVLGSYSTKNPVAQRHNHVATFDQWRDQQTLIGATVYLGHNQILSHVDQTPCQVSGVRRLQGGIRQTFTRTVSRDEVLQYVQTFAEVRGDRRLDDRAIRLGHQAPHTGKLTNLGRGTPRTGISHHIYRVEGVLNNLVTRLDHGLFL